MPKNRIAEIGVKDIHALWLLTQNGEAFHKEEIYQISQEVLKYSNQCDLRRLLEIGEYIGLVSRQGERWLLTAEGENFKKALHWRLWVPAESTKTILQASRILHFFIDQQAYGKRPVVIDLFAGVGGLSLGFAVAGFQVALAVENDQQAYEAHTENFPETLVLQDDVNKFADNPREYIEKINQLNGVKFAGIIGGPPCQGFSYIGERTARDERNLLTSRFMDIVLELKPDFFVMENVPGIATTGIPPKFSVYIKRLAKSNSEPASSIVDRLPSVPKKVAQRDRQFRKRQISNVIDGLKSRVNACFKKNRLVSPKDVQKAIRFSHNELEKLISNIVSEVYNDEQLARRILQESENEVCIIAIAIVFAQLLDNKMLDYGRGKEFCRGFREKPHYSETLHRAILQIYDDYDNAPFVGEYKGQEVGPVLLHLLERAGEFYDVPAPEVLNAASFGTPQNRERMFIVGIHKRLKKTFVYPEPTHCWNGTNGKAPTPTAYDAIHDLPDIDQMPHLIEDYKFSVKELTKPESDFVRQMRYEIIEDGDLSLSRKSWNPYSVDCSNRTTHAEHVVERMKTLEYGKQDPVSRRSRLHPDRPSPTIRAGTKQNKGSHTAVRPIHYKCHRVISVREAARLMGYPDWMTFHKAKWHGFRLIGNGVPLPLSRAIAKQIKGLLYESS